MSINQNIKLQAASFSKFFISDSFFNFVRTFELAIQHRKVGIVTARNSTLKKLSVVHYKYDVLDEHYEVYIVIIKYMNFSRCYNCFKIDDLQTIF